MRHHMKFMLAAAAAVLLALGEFAPPAWSQSKGQMVIVFKDGRRQSFPLAEITRVEFEEAAGAAASRASGGRFQGRWKVGDGAGGTFEITLDRDGRAHKTLGQSDGTWTVVNGEARITWKDGWKDVIRKSGRQYQKLAFAPDRTFSDSPSNIADAEYTEAH